MSRSSLQASLLTGGRGFTGLIGFAREDITPPAGIFFRYWGPAIDERSRTERLCRAKLREDLSGAGGNANFRVWVWRVGQAVIVAHAGEAYACFQRELRAKFGDRSVVVLNVTDGAGPVYLPPAELDDHDAYSVWQTVMARGTLERIYARVQYAISELIESTPEEQLT